MLRDIYPDFQWNDWLFERVVNNYWDDEKNVRAFIDWATKKLNVS